MDRKQVDGGRTLSSLRCLRLTAQIMAVLKQAVLGVQAGREVCGLLGGFRIGSDAAVVTVVHHLRNISGLRGCFAIDIDEFIGSKETMETAGLQPLALFHSHPGGTTRPSLRDTKLPWITGLLSLIVAENRGELLMNGYTYVEGKQISIEILATQGRNKGWDLVPVKKN